MSDERDRSHQLFGVLAAVIAVVLFGGAVAVLVDAEPGVPASGARATVDGEVLVVHGDGSSDRLETGDLVAAGDEVRVQSGTVVLELASGAVLEGREGPEVDGGRDVVEGTRVEIGATPELLAGDLLARGRVPVTVGAGGNEVSLVPGDGDGAVKVRRGLSVTVGAYEGAAQLDSAGQERSIPTYRQLSVATIGRPPASPDPLRLDAADRWDLRYLGLAFELTRRLDSLSGTYTSNVGPAGATAQALAAILPQLASEDDFGTELIVDERNTSRPGGELLVGLSIALLGRDGDFGERYDAVRDFRDDGADWGLVALDQGVGDSDLIDTVEAAFGRAVEPGDVAAVPSPVAGTTPSTAPGATDTSPTTTGGGGNDGSTTTTSPPTSSGPTVPPTTLPPLLTLPTLPPPPGEEDVLLDTGVPLVDDAVEPLDDLLAGLIGG